jgi:hypothetical protein
MTAFEHGNERPGGMKDGKYFEQMSDYQLPKNNTAKDH